MSRSTVILALLFLAVARSHGALNEPERRIRLGTCDTDHCVWCQDQFDAVCPSAVAVIDHDPVCNVDRSCDVGGGCALNSGTSFNGELVMMVDDAPCGAATGACNHGNGAVTKLAFCGTRADSSRFTIATTKIDCCRHASSPTGNVACGTVADTCTPRGNPFLCDQEHGNCADNSSCCVSEDVIPNASWLGLQIFPPTMAAALRTAVPGTGLPVMTAAADLGRDDHSADGQPSIQRYGVQVTFVTPPADFSAPLPDCQVTIGGTPTPHATCDFCGDGELDPGEQCDDGPANGTAGSCCDASCAVKPACGQPIAGKSLSVTDDPDPTKRKIVFVSKDAGIDTTVGSGIDAVANGASLQVFNANGSGESACFPLPSAGGSWVVKGKPPTPSYTYKDATGAAGPCKTVKVKHGKLLQAVCSAKARPIGYSLDEPSQGALAVRFTSGGKTYCATFGGVVSADSGTNPPNTRGKGKFKAKDAPAVPCTSPPAPCP